MWQALEPAGRPKTAVFTRAKCRTILSGSAALAPFDRQSSKLGVVVEDLASWTVAMRFTGEMVARQHVERILRPSATSIFPDRTAAPPAGAAS